MAAAPPRATSATPSLALSPAERAAVVAELAAVSARVAALAARLERLHTALAMPTRVTTPSASALPVREAAPGLVTASEARPWR